MSEGEDGFKHAVTNTPGERADVGAADNLLGPSSDVPCVEPSTGGVLTRLRRRFRRCECVEWAWIGSGRIWVERCPRHGTLEEGS